MEIEHIEPHGLSYGNLLACHIRPRMQSGGRPVAPAYRRAQHHAPAVEPQYGLLADTIGREPPETESAPVAVDRSLAVGQGNITLIQFGRIDVPQTRVGHINLQFHAVVARLQIQLARAACHHLVRHVLWCNSIPDSTHCHLGTCVTHIHYRFHAGWHRLILHIYVLDVYRVDNIEPDPADKTTESASGRNLVITPAHLSKILPVEITSGIGDTHCKSVCFARDEGIGNVDVKRRLADDVVADKPTVEIHLGTHSHRLEVKHGTASFQIPRHTDGGEPPAHALEIVGRRTLRCRKILLDCARHTHTDGIFGGKHLPPSCRCVHRQILYRSYLFRQIKPVVFPRCGGIAHHMPARAVKRKSVARRRGRRHGVARR
ncbi:hypothetical protein IMSAG192_00658 [Muribaculaceae bacterium]|nr:hypothetical protein IMSAG192_00658 [Muribaculaceae bacterium]